MVAISEGKNIVLTKDVVITDPMNITIPTNIDLNGKSLTVSRLEANAELTINGGTLENGEAIYPAISVNDGGKLVLSGILNTKADVVYEAIAKHNLKTIAIDELNQWVAITVEK